MQSHEFQRVYLAVVEAYAARGLDDVSKPREIVCPRIILVQPLGRIFRMRHQDAGARSITAVGMLDRPCLFTTGRLWQ